MATDAGPGRGCCFEDLEVGMEASLRRTFSDADVQAFAEVSGDLNPAHLDDAFARRTRLGHRVVHGMLTASLVTAVLGCQLPGPGCLFVSQSTNFRKPVRPGDAVEAHVRLARLDPRRQFAEFETRCAVGDVTVLEGSALLWIPSKHEEFA